MRAFVAFTALAAFTGTRASPADNYKSPQVDVAVRDSLAYSPPVYPSPWMDPKAPGWEEAYAKAREFVSQLTIHEKVNLTTGVG